ncbi:MAG: NB-ARC domain-containing protein [Verrucomicrobia bacterium]|nr:NB-ARC domain-containing protein [Verrucomicrobiota bacterium]
MKPLEQMWQRVEVARQDSDAELFSALLLAGELVLKLAAVGLLAGIPDDRERHRYRLAFKLVRADGLGDWATSLDDILKGPASHQLCEPAKQTEKAELVQPCEVGSWLHEAIFSLKAVMDCLKLQYDPLPTKLDGRRWFSMFATLRNGTRGHGATLPSVKSAACPHLEKSIRLFTEHFTLFKREWAYLFRNISGKYRVTKISPSAKAFDPLKGSTHAAFANGVYVYFDEPRRIELLESSPETTDFYVPNGKFTDKKFELISYVTDDRLDSDAAPYLTPAENLPGSETRALGRFEIVGNCFANIPTVPKGYIQRPILEAALQESLLAEEKDRIVTLSGRGGIGKTSLALQVLHKVSLERRYEVICWFSARDIDLLVDGPQQVTPDVLTDTDIAKSFVNLVEPCNRREKGFNAKSFFEAHLSRNEANSLGPILFVFDNFETVRNPPTLFMWLHQFVRHPNKILITARHKEFTGDFEIRVDGMTEDECRALIGATAAKLGIEDLLTETYILRLIDESDGHPYVIKVLLGEVAKARKLVDVPRILATQDRILHALFERTFSALTPAAQRVFLTLCNWHSAMPVIALQAVLLRPANERMDVIGAVDELRKSSLVEIFQSVGDKEEFLNVPIAALEFGHAKLTTSALKTAVQADSQYLQMFGAAQKNDIRHGMAPRVERLFSNVSRTIANDFKKLDNFLPIIQLVAQHLPAAWLALASLYEEEGSKQSLEEAKACLRRHLEATPASASSFVWKRLADLCERTNDFVGAVHALVEMCEHSVVPFFVVSNTANKLNNLFRSGSLRLDTDEKRILIRRLAAVMSERLSEANADDYSRLAWLYLHLNEDDQAKLLTEEGLKIDGENEHLTRLAQKFSLL